MKLFSDSSVSLHNQGKVKKKCAQGNAQPVTDLQQQQNIKLTFTKTITVFFLGLWWNTHIIT